MEWMHYPQCYIPPGDIGMRFLTDDQPTSARGRGRRIGIA